jgi:hypothetical protein
MVKAPNFGRAILEAKKMRTSKLNLGIATVVLLTGMVSCGGSSGVSGRYVGEVEEMGWKMELDFHGDGKATLTMSEGDNGHPMDCTYETGEKRVLVNCLGSSGISLTQLDNGDLEGDMGGTIVRYKKR